MKSLMKNETGAALVTAILVLMLATGLTLGMFAALTSNSRSQAADRDQSVAYAAAHAGLEKLTASLAELFGTDFSPNATQIGLVDAPANVPAIPGFTFTAPGGSAGSGYDISFTPDTATGNVGNPKPLANADIVTGPFEGFKGLITPYVLTVTARSTTGNSEVRLRRELQTVAVPVFQFGIFGQKDLAFHAGPNFDFGGRVHTNQSLYLANGSGNTLTFRDKITALTQVVRDRLSNGELITNTGHTGTVSVPRVIGLTSTTYRNLLSTESSGTITGPCITTGNTMNSLCWSGWKNLSEVTYGANIRTAATGARELNLPIVTGNNATPIDLIRRPVPGEDVALPNVLSQRYYTQASLRILISDRDTDITGLPGQGPGLPIDLAAWAGQQVGPPFRAPIARSGTAAEPRAANGTSLTRLRDLNNTNTGDIRFQTDLAATGTWVDTGVPSWLTWSSLTHAAGTVSCNGYEAAARTFRDCTHVASLANGSTLTITPGDGSPAFTGTLQATSNTNSDIQLTNTFTMQQKLAATRGFFIGEDYVVCTSVGRQSDYNGSLRLRGCTWNGSPDVNDPVYTGVTTAPNTHLVHGWIKIEQQRDPIGLTPVWADVTAEILNLGFAAANDQGDPCGDPTPNAIIRLQRLRDNALTSDQCGAGVAAPAVNSYHASQNPTDYWPLMLFDPREGANRRQDPDNNQVLQMGGLFSYVAFDANNFRQWLAGAGVFAGSGSLTLNNNGYIIYFSDRRGDHNELAGDVETGEYGNEDLVNPASFAATKNNSLDVGENFNESVVAGVETQDTYGETPHPLAVPTGAFVPVAGLGFEAATHRPWSSIPQLYSGRGRIARPILFRRALKIINGGLNQLPAAGITIVAENPVYVQGNFNAADSPTSGSPTGVTTEPNVPAAIMGDSITLLSRNWKDWYSFVSPQKAADRPALTTGYRFAMVTGKTVPFPKPSWANDSDEAHSNEYGSDGGVHNFMKMLENWGGQTLMYRGSMVSLYYSRQSVGIYRADANIYSPPTRGYNFDTDFLSPPLLPPGTPMFRDINTLKFRQILRPTQ